MYEADCSWMQDGFTCNQCVTLDTETGELVKYFNDSESERIKVTGDLALATV